MSLRIIEYLKSLQNVVVKKGEKVLSSVFFRHVSFLTFSNAATAFLGIVQTLVIARWLGPEKYGIVALIINYPQLIYSILNVRTIEGTTKFLSEFKVIKDLPKVISICKISYTLDVTISCLTFLIVMMTSPWAAKSLFKQPSIAPLMTLYTLSFFAGGFYNTSYAILATFYQFSLLAWTNLVFRSIQFFVVIFLTHFYGVTGVILGMILGTVIQAMFITYLAYQMIGTKWKEFLTIRPLLILKGRLKELFQFYLLTSITLLVALPMQQLDITLIGYFRKPSEVGCYKIAKTIASSLIYLVDALQQVSYPRLASEWVQDRACFIHRLKRLTLLGVTLGALALSTIVFAVSVPKVLLGRHFNEAISPLIWLWIAFSLRVTFFWLRPFFLSTGKVGFWFGLQSSGVIMGMIVMFSGAMLWGANGVALSVLIYYVFIFLFGVPTSYTLCYRKGIKNNVSLY